MKKTKTTGPVDKARHKEDAQAWTRRRYAAYRGLDVHTDTDRSVSCRRSAELRTAVSGRDPPYRQGIGLFTR